MKYKFKIIISFIYISLIFSINGCINLREDYPIINYYSLSNLSSKELRQKIPGVLQIRNFTAPLYLSGQRILVENFDGSSQRYYYHRWSDNFDQLLTWLAISKISSLKVFTGGVVSQNTNLIPDYVLEGELLNYRPFNHKIEDSSFVEMTIKFTLIGFNQDSANYRLYFTRVYNQKISRNNRPASIPIATNLAANEIIDLLINDIINNVLD